MKTLKKLWVVVASVFALGLAGCKFEPAKSSSEPTPVEPGEVTLSGISISGEYKTEYEIGEEFDATGIVVTASYSDESSSDVTSETTFSGFDSSVAGPVVVTATYLEKTAEINLIVIEHVYSVEEVAADFSASISAAVGATVTLTDKGTYFGVTLNFSKEGEDYSNTQAEESVLAPVASALASLAPEYLTVVGAKYFTSEEDFWEDESGDTAYYVYLEATESVGVDIIAYCYNGYLLGQIAVYDLA